MGPRATRWRLWSGWGFDLTAGALCVVAAFTAWRKAHDLSWPCENDLYRDMGVAQGILDGRLGADPAYLGEHGWYNPLVPALVGGVSRLTSVPLHTGYATLGVYLNLLAPAALYGLVALLFQRGAALATLLGFLFLGRLDVMSWLAATYSPWLWSCNLAQGFFYLAAGAWVVVLRRRSFGVGVVAGVAWGLTALAHTAPAMILCVVVVSSALVELFRIRTDGVAAKRLLGLASTVGVVAMIVAVPFWWSIVVDYRARVQNPVPLAWVANELLLDRWHELFLVLPSLRGGFALVGLAGLLWPGALPSAHARSVLVAWGAACVLGIAYGYAVQSWHFAPFLPSWHFYFYFYFQALQSVLFGVGVLVLVRQASELANRFRLPLFDAPRSREPRVFAVAIALLAGVVAFRWKDYRARTDLVENRRASQKLAKAPSTELYRWVLEHTEPTDVFLTDLEQGFFAVGAAGRKVVVLQDLFSNPYVDVTALATPRACAKAWRLHALANFSQRLGATRSATSRFRHPSARPSSGDRSRSCAASSAREERSGSMCTSSAERATNRESARGVGDQGKSTAS